MLLRAGRVESITISRDKRIVQVIKNKSGQSAVREKRAGKQDGDSKKQVLKSPMPKKREGSPGSHAAIVKEERSRISC